MIKNNKTRKIVICDYENAMENDYEPTIRSIKKALKESDENYSVSEIREDGKENCNIVHAKDDIIDIITEKDNIKIDIVCYKNTEELIENIKDADGIITGFLEIGEDILKYAPRLQCISVSGVGYSNIDVEAAKRHGVTVCHIKEYCTEEVAEHTLALISALNRNLKYYNKNIETEYEWKYHTISGGRNLTSQTLAIFGFGKIGKRVAKIAKAYGMEVIAVDPYVQSNDALIEEAANMGISIVSCDYALHNADIITNHMNLTQDNYHFFNKERFEEMIKKPLFINVGRGGSVSEEALINALDKGMIRGAGLDVLEEENPILKTNRLLGRSNVIITPHSAFYSEESMEKLQTISGANMGYVLGGRIEKAYETV